MRVPLSVWTKEMIQKNCGSCQYFRKVTGFGICALYDYWTQSDRGRHCEGWKGIKYERETNTSKSKIIQSEINLD
jgi:hypothetical protein